MFHNGSKHNNYQLGQGYAQLTHKHVGNLGFLIQLILKTTNPNLDKEEIDPPPPQIFRV